MVVTWNTLDKSANITLSGGSLVATTTSATQGAVRAGTATAATKTYVEFQITNATGSLWAVGFANATAALGSALGSDTNSVVYQPNTSTGRIFFNNASLGSDTFAPVAGQTVCVAFDPVGKLIWARIDNGLWNGSTTADPASGTGGRSVAAIAAGPYFPIFGDNGSGGAVTARFGALNMWFPVPTGFSDLDVTSQAYLAVSKMDGYAVLGAPQNAVSVSKMLGYVIAATKPFGPETEKWPLVYAKPRRVFLDGSTASSIALLTAPPPNPFTPTEWSAPYPVIRRDVSFAGTQLPLSASSAIPFFGNVEAVPQRPQGRLLEVYSGFNPANFPATTIPFIGIADALHSARSGLLHDTTRGILPSSVAAATPFFGLVGDLPRRRVRFTPERQHNPNPRPKTLQFAYILLASI